MRVLAKNKEPQALQGTENHWSKDAGNADLGHHDVDRMESSIMSSYARPHSPAVVSSAKGNGKASCFVLKLNNMVNGAPDDIVSWVPTGEAFRISDLSRLESETLPQYFRHNRFQSLVRQLNFYNFRKINRERTFWVYYHPLFHRDRPDEMFMLRRRTCPGYDGRKNRPSGGISPYDEMVGEDGDLEEFGASNATLVTPTAAGYEVSRSPSPTSSSSATDHAPAGSGSDVRSSINRGSSLKPVVSVEEKSPSDNRPRTIRRRSTSSSASFGVVESNKDFYIAAADESTTFTSNQCFTDTLFQADECYVEQLNQYFPGTANPNTSEKYTETAAAVSSDNEDDSSMCSSPLTHQKSSKEKNHERQDHVLAVLEVSRDLNGICSDYNASISRDKPRGRAGRGSSGNAQTRHAGPSAAFGLDKPHDHYYGAGKCDLFTYDCEDVIDDVDKGCTEEDTIDEEVVGPANENLKEVSSEPTKIPPPPSQCPIVTQSLAQACLEGKIVNCASTFDRTLASAILWFCLSTHPQDPDLAKKISHHLKKRPMLAQEFEMYCKAMSPGLIVWGASEDLKRDWKMFSANFMNRVDLEYDKFMGLTELEYNALVAFECWFRDD